jgi:BMFP domain-containing protein YqiC
MNKTPKQKAAERYFSLNRRRFLRGLGACVALPAFESLFTARAAGLASAGSGGAKAAAAPRRVAFLYFPNGAHQAYWWPKGEGKDFEFSQTMTPLQKLKNKLQVIGGLDHINATAGPDGAGDHARANGTFMTGVRVKKTAGADIHAGVSIDQVIAKYTGHLTRFPSLELTCDAVRKSGNCDSGYSCAYQHNLSWRSPTTPNAPEPNPRLLFERLFGAGAHGERQKNLEMRQQQQRSILDFVMDDARDLQRQLASKDRAKLDEYLTSVRELENRIGQAEQFKERTDPKVQTPAGIPANYQEHMQIMYNMLALAFQTDSTRIATFLLAGDGNNRAYGEIGIPEGHHYLSHHRGNHEMMEKLAQIDLWYMKQFAQFLQKLEDTKDVDGNSILHNSMVVYGCGNSDGNRHTHVNLPIILAGSAGGALQPGRYLNANSKPMCNLFLSMADAMNVNHLERFGDSTGRYTAVTS